MKLQESIPFISKKLHEFRFLQDILWFAVIIYGFHILWWKGGLGHFLRQYASFDDLQEFIAHQVFLPASWIVGHVVGYTIQTFNNTIDITGHGYVAVEGSCSGLKQMYEWVALMILFPGPWKHKLWFIPAGILIIHLENILRIVILSVAVVHWPAQWDFIHMWIMRPFYYVVIFLLWLVWVEKIKGKKRLASEKSI